MNLSSSQENYGIFFFLISQVSKYGFFGSCLSLELLLSKKKMSKTRNVWEMLLVT